MVVRKSLMSRMGKIPELTRCSIRWYSEWQTSIILLEGMILCLTGLAGIG